MMTLSWWMLGGAVAAVLAIGAIGAGCAQHEGAALAGVEVQQHELTMQAKAVARLEKDIRWEIVDQREGLCSAFSDNVRTALTNGAIAQEDRVRFTWLPTENVLSGLAAEALLGGADGTSKYAQMNRLLRDKRWAFPDQRGPLCNALIEVQRTPLEVS
jgi:hypothetical protein